VASKILVVDVEFCSHINVEIICNRIYLIKLVNGVEAWRITLKKTMSLHYLISWIRTMSQVIKFVLVNAATQFSQVNNGEKKGYELSHFLYDTARTLEYATHRSLTS